MKRIVSQIVYILVLVLLLASCEYKEITDAEYPEQMIYMPAATAGIYTASSGSNTFQVPTSGNTAGYYVDETKSKVVVPLSVFRSGIDRKGSISVDISADADTISHLIADGTLANTVLIASDKYTLPAAVNIAEGGELSRFDLGIDLGLLRANPTKKFAIGVHVSSRNGSTNEKFSTAIVVFDASVLKP